MKKELKRVFGCLTAGALLVGSGFMGACGKESGTGEEGGYENRSVVAYVPMDDRPVNIDRVEYLAESLDYTLVMPDADLYKTHLDNQEVNSNGTQYGDRNAILQWLKTTEADEYVVSLDQVLSGGLVESRIFTEEDLRETYRIIDDLLEVIGDKRAVVTDTVVRLASTLGYGGYGTDVYEGLRAYGATARAVLSGEDLNIENIVKGYPYDENGEKIPYGIEEGIVFEHLAVRERKLKIADYYLEKVKTKTNIYTVYGVDDSSPKNTVQSNEIDYISGKLKNGVVFSACDELALMSFTRLYLENFQNEISVNVSYFGGGEELSCEYDTGTLEESMEKHLEALNIAENENAELQVLVLTQPESGLKEDYETSAVELTEKAKLYIEKKKPVIVIDESTTSLYATYRKLQGELIQKVDLGMLLAYSNWNTGANAIGVALANGAARYGYLKYGKVTKRGNEAFLKTLAFSYVKDIAYKSMYCERIGNYIVNTLKADKDNFYADLGKSGVEELNGYTERTLLADSGTCGIKAILKNFNRSDYIVSLKKYRTETHKTASVTSFYFPWYRIFEMAFSVNFS